MFFNEYKKGKSFYNKLNDAVIMLLTIVKILRWLSKSSKNSKLKLMDDIN